MCRPNRVVLAQRLQRPVLVMPGRRTALPLAVFLLVAGFGFAAAGRAEEGRDHAAVAAALDRAAEAEGASYAVARDMFARRGEAIVPLLQEMARSPDWRRWSLAELLLLRIGEPERAARWRDGLTDQQGWRAGEDDGGFVARKLMPATIVVPWPAAGGVEPRAVEPPAEAAPLDEREIRYGREALPVILDVMREFAEAASRGSSPAESIFRRAAAALEHVADPRVAEPLLHYSTVRSWDREAGVVAALVGLGPDAVPALHEAARRGDGNFHQVRRANLAARALGEIGDRSSAAVLVETLDRLAAVESIPIFCEAIRRIGPDGAAEVVFTQLLDAGAGWPDRKFPASGVSDRLTASASAGLAQYFGVYAAIRAEVLAFGPAAEAVVARRSGPGAPVLHRAIAAGVAYELKNREQAAALYKQVGSVLAAHESYLGTRSDGKEIDLVEFGYRRFWSARGFSGWTPADAAVPAPLRVEKAALRPTEHELRALGGLKGDALAFEVLQWLLVEEPHARRSQPAAILALAEAGGAKSVDVFRRRLEQQPPLDVETVVEALILVGDPRGAEVLDAIAQREGTTPAFSQPAYRAAAEAARAVAPRLRGGPDRLVELLDAEPVSLRHTAARSLAARGDIRAVPVLFETALAAVPELSARTAWRPSDAELAAHRRARDAIVALGPPALPALRRAAEQSEAAHAGLLAEAIALRIERPELAERLRRAGVRRTPGFAHMLGPGVADYRILGMQAAEMLGAEGVPLLEATIVWRADPMLPAVAAFALAELRQERSIGIVASHALTINSTSARRGESLAAAALHDFGEEGVEAARHVPEPDPERAGFDRRSARHRAAAETRALADDEKGIDAVLAGLRLAAAGKIDAASTNVYLRIARQTPDPRLVPAVIAAVDRHGREVAGEALNVLAPTADPRILPVCMRFLGDGSAGTNRQALRGIGAVQREKTPSFLLEELDRVKEPADRAAIARALGHLRRAAQPGLGDDELSQEVLDRHAPQVRRALLGRLDDADAEVQTAAAESLAQFLAGREDDEAAARLTAWLRGRTQWPYQVLQYVVSTRAEAVAPALHAMYREEPLRRAQLAGHLATLKHDAAMGDVRAALDDRMTTGQTRWGIPEVAVLLDFGPAGREALTAATDRHGDLPFRVEALSGLVLRGHRPALEPAARLFDELVENGLGDPRLQARPSRSDFHSHATWTLARALLAADASAAYPRVARACLAPSVPPPVRNRLAGEVREALGRHPELADVEVALPPEPFADAENDLPALPLLAAAEAWLEAVEQCGSPGPPDAVRDRVIAGGVDSLQIGIELFYPWPTPGREQVAAALADLGAADMPQRRRAEALLAVRAYPASYLDDALAAAEGETFRRGLAIRRWRRQGGRLLDADIRLRGAFTTWMLAHWPIDEMRRFTLGELDRLATIRREEPIWGQQPLYPLLASLRYSLDSCDRERLAAFAGAARPAAAAVARSVLARGATDMRDHLDRWGPLP